MWLGTTIQIKFLELVLILNIFVKFIYDIHLNFVSFNIKKINRFEFFISIHTHSNAYTSRPFVNELCKKLPFQEDMLEIRLVWADINYVTHKRIQSQKVYNYSGDLRRRYVETLWLWGSFNIMRKISDSF